MWRHKAKTIFCHAYMVMSLWMRKLAHDAEPWRQTVPILMEDLPGHCQINAFHRNWRLTQSYAKFSAQMRKKCITAEKKGKLTSTPTFLGRQWSDFLSPIHNCYFASESFWLVMWISCDHHVTSTDIVPRTEKYKNNELKSLPLLKS